MICDDIPKDLLLAATAPAIRAKLVRLPSILSLDVAVVDGTIVLKAVAAHVSGSHEAHRIVESLTHEIPVRPLFLIASRADQY